MNDQERDARVKAMLVELEVIAEKHAPRVVRAAGDELDRAALMLALVDACELGMRAERARIAGNLTLDFLRFIR